MFYPTLDNLYHTTGYIIIRIGRCCSFFLICFLCILSERIFLMCMRQSIIRRIYMRSYIHILHFFISFVRTIDQRRLFLIPFRNWCDPEIFQKCNSFALLRYTCFALINILLDIFVLTRPLTSPLAELCFFISLCSHNFEHKTLSRLYWHFTGQDLLSLSYMLRFFLDITCIRCDARRMRCNIRCMFWESILYLFAHCSARNQKQPF